MREYIRAVISPEDAFKLSCSVDYQDFDNCLVKPVVNQVLKLADISLNSPSYCRVEDRSEGHPWHVDRGNLGHMEWCQYSASVLLTPSGRFTGGGFYFRDQPDRPIYHYLDLIFFDSIDENAHLVRQNSGERRALIMFFQGLGD